ncbi:unnamed protein product [Lactuca virosa]|uniref:Uncharacterized protein n=1 Tax=Lactuca virosa TaxID=75947 RepID=A0AAU9MPA1_9ASTR|nr:unnamed protein product [Lactuca virosa]
MSSPLSATVSVHQCTSHAPQDTDYPICTTTISSSLQPPVRFKIVTFASRLMPPAFIFPCIFDGFGHGGAYCCCKLRCALTAGQLVFGFYLRNKSQFRVY